MHRPIARIRGLGFLIWHTRHEFYHILLGLVWAWFLRERWGQFNARWVWLSVFGSLLPDADHIIYFITYGRKDFYTKQVRFFLRNHEWRNLWVFIENGHKFNTSLSAHNYYIVSMLLISSAVSSIVDWQAGVILFGAMLIHYFFDIVDDVFILGRVNPNWRRWGRENTEAAHQIRKKRT